LETPFFLRQRTYTVYQVHEVFGKLARINFQQVHVVRYAITALRLSRCCVRLGRKLSWRAH